MDDFTDKINVYIPCTNYTMYRLYDNLTKISIANSLKLIKDVFVLIKKFKWNEFIQTITCLKWLLPVAVTLFLAKQSGLPLDQDFSDFVDFVRISKIN